MDLLPLYNFIALIGYLEGFPGGSVVKNQPAKQETQIPSLDQADSLEKEMATHSSIVGWKIPWAGGAWWATVHRVAKESDMTKQLNNNTTGHLELLSPLLQCVWVFQDALHPVMYPPKPRHT